MNLTPVTASYLELVFLSVIIATFILARKFSRNAPKRQSWFLYLSNIFSGFAFFSMGGFLLAEWFDNRFLSLPLFPAPTLAITSVLCWMMAPESKNEKSYLSFVLSVTIIVIALILSLMFSRVIPLPCTSNKICEAVNHAWFCNKHESSVGKCVEAILTL